jgi:TonB family protein
MAHRSMPKPDPAGRLFPVELPPAPDNSLLAISPTPAPIQTRSSRDYWEIIFGVLVVAATLFVGWRIAQIALTRVEHPQATTSPVNSTSSIRDTQTSPDPSLPKKLTSHPSKPAADQTSPVVIQAIVGTDGKVKKAKVVQGNPKLAPAALETVRQLSFTPYAPNGTAVEFETQVVVSQPGGHQTSNDNLRISIPQQATKQQTTAP